MSLLEPSPLFGEQEAEYSRLRDRARAQHERQREVFLNAHSIVAFCETALIPGFDLMAKLFTRLTLSFDKPAGSQFIRPSPMPWVMGKEVLGVMTNLKDLTITGLPNPSTDGWILDGCAVLLDRFCTDLSFQSKEMIHFFKKQRRLTELYLLPHPRHGRIDPVRNLSDLAHQIDGNARMAFIEYRFVCLNDLST